MLVDSHRAVRLSDPPFKVVHTPMADLCWRREDDLVLAAPPRALADVAADPSVTDLQLRTAVDALRNRFRLNTALLVREWEDLPGRGARRLLRMAAEGVFEQESEGERRAFAQLFAPCPPVPDCQVYVLPRIRVDFVFVYAAFILEYYGEEAHANSVDRDGSRSWALRQGDCEVLVVTKSMVAEGAALTRHVHDVRRRREQERAAGRINPPPLPPQPPRLTPLRTLSALG